MYPVASNFHNLSIQDAPKTRIRIYFIGDSVDCTDDNDVQTNGTLLVGAVGDTDSNGRIAQDGVTITDMFNPGRNIHIGDCVSNQIEMTLLNADGALNGLAWGRCKVYLDVYDDANTAWLPCPMGVYIIDKPTGTMRKNVHVVGFDQMQLLDASAEAWWNSFQWWPEKLCKTFVESLTAQIGVSLGSYPNWFDNITFAMQFPNIDAKGKSYKDIIQLFCEAHSVYPKFGRDGSLGFLQFNKLSADYTVDADASPTRCLSINVGEYAVEKIGTVTANLGTATFTETRTSVDYPNPKNKYVVSGNGFMNPAKTTGNNSISYLTGSILDILFYVVTPYIPTQMRFIADWSIDAGDIIQITFGGATINFPIFQQTMLWRGGNVVSTATNDGDPVIPWGDQSFTKESRQVAFVVKGGAGTVDTDIYLAPGECALIVLSGAKSGSKAISLVNCTEDGTVSRKNVSSGENYSYTNGTYSLTIRNSSHEDQYGVKISF